MANNPLDTSEVDEKLVNIISFFSLNTVEDVIGLMRAIDEILPNDDGLKWFNLLYLNVTEGLLEHPPIDGWENQTFVDRLAVIFAGLYFNAAVRWQQDRSSTPRAWRPLFASRWQSGIMRVQFAIAGLNAHINHDLAIALVQTSEEIGTVPRHGTPEHRDFNKVNPILETVTERVKLFLATGIVGAVDQDLGRLDDVVALWSVRKARETAWDNGEILWHSRNIPAFSDLFLRNIDRLVGLSSRGLLIPVGR